MDASDFVAPNQAAPVAAPPAGPGEGDGAASPATPVNKGQPQSNADISTLIDQAADKFNTQINSSLADLDKLLGSANAATNQDIAGENSLADAKVKINTAVMEAAMKKDADTKAVAASIGADPDASSYILTTLGQSIRAGQLGLMQRRQDLQQTADVSFTDDPLGWLAAQISLPSKAAAYNIAEEGVNQNNEALKDIMGRVTEAGTMNAALDTSNTLDKLSALNQAELATAAKDVASSRLAAIKLGIQGLDIRKSMNMEQFTVLHDVVQTDVALANLKLTQDYRDTQMTHIALEERNMELQEQMRKEQIEAKNNNLQSINSITQRLNRVSSIYGLDPISYLEYEKMSPQRRNIYDQLMQDPNVDEGRAGYTPADALNNMNNINAPGNPGLNLVRKRLTEINNGTMSANQATWSSLKPDQKMVLENAGIEQAVKKEANNVPAVGGVYSPPPMLATIASVPAIAQLPLSQALGPIAGADNKYPLVADDVFKTALQLVQEGKLSIPDAANQVSSIYKTAVDLNNQTRQFSKLALPGQVDFRTTVFTGGGWNTTVNIDMTNAAAVESVMTRRLVAIQANQPFTESSAGTKFNKTDTGSANIAPPGL